jgi:hypothetical protein
MHVLQDCMPLSHTRLSVTNDSDIFQTVSVIGITEFSREHVSCKNQCAGQADPRDQVFGYLRCRRQMMTIRSCVHRLRLNSVMPITLTVWKISESFVTDRRDADIQTPDPGDLPDPRTDSYNSHVLLSYLSEVHPSSLLGSFVPYGTGLDEGCEFDFDCHSRFDNPLGRGLCMYPYLY